MLLCPESMAGSPAIAHLIAPDGGIELSSGDMSCFPTPLPSWQGFGAGFSNPYHSVILFVCPADSESVTGIH